MHGVDKSGQGNLQRLETSMGDRVSGASPQEMNMRMRTFLVDTKTAKIDYCGKIEYMYHINVLAKNRYHSNVLAKQYCRKFVHL